MSQNAVVQGAPEFAAARIMTPTPASVASETRDLLYSRYGLKKLAEIGG